MNFKEITDRLTAEGITTAEFFRLFPKFYTDRGQHKAGNERLPWLGKVNIVRSEMEIDEDITINTYYLPEHDVYLDLYGSMRACTPDEEEDQIIAFPQYPECVLTFCDWFNHVVPYQYTETRYRQVSMGSDQQQYKFKRYLVFKYLVGDHHFEEGKHHEPVCDADTLEEAIELLVKNPDCTDKHIFYWLDLQDRQYSILFQEINFTTRYFQRLKEINTVA